MKKTIAILLAFLGLIGLLAGCSPALVDAELVNTETIELAGISDIEIAYGSENITFFDSTDGSIIVKEYMSENKEKYYAKVTHSGSSLVIQTGERPTITTFSSYIEVYLPSEYVGRLSIKTQSGAIKSNVSYVFSDFNAESHSGAIEFGNLTAANITIETKSGNITCNTVEGNISAKSTSGHFQFTDITGYGSFNADSSSIDLRFAEMTGNVTAYSKSGAVDFSAPAGASFNLSATTNSGKISNSLSGNINTTDKTATGSIGDNPEYSVNLSTSSGPINVK